MAAGGSNAGSIAGAGKPTQFRVFLASPGDVPLERKLAREAITHISSERRFRSRIDIEIIAWDQHPARRWRWRPGTRQSFPLQAHLSLEEAETILTAGVAMAPAEWW